MISAKNLEEFLSMFVKQVDFEFEKKGRIYFLKNPGPSSLSNSSNAFSSSLPLGQEKNFFEPSLFLLELLSKRSKNKVFINSEAEWFFLCGRNVFPDNIVKNASKEKIFLVQSEKDENLGLGMLTKDKGRKVIKNLKDRGDFLRRENS